MTGFVQRELDRIGEALRADPEAPNYDRLYAAQQALAWASDPEAFLPPSKMINCQQGTGCPAPADPSAPAVVQPLSAMSHVASGPSGTDLINE